MRGGNSREMRWQDLLLTVCNVALIAALLPTVMSRHDKPALATSVLTGTVLGLMAFVYFSLALWFAAVTGAVECILWLAIAVQTRARRRTAPTA